MKAMLILCKLMHYSNFIFWYCEPVIHHYSPFPQSFPVFCSICYRTLENIEIEWNSGTKLVHCVCLPLRENCPNSTFFRSIFSRIRIECGEILGISPYSSRMREKTDQKNHEYEHFLLNVMYLFWCANIPSGISERFLRSPSSIASTIAEIIVRTRRKVCR